MHIISIASAPQGGEHGDDLLLTAHDTGQEQGIILGGHAEGLLDSFVIAQIDELGAACGNNHISEDWL